KLRLCWGNFDYGFNFYHAFINPTCPYCRRTQKLVSQLPFKQGLLEFVDITANGDTNEIQDYLQQLTGARTVPRVFITVAIITNKAQGVKTINTKRTPTW
uniref:Glutaredoxin domain-containing protein n=1 Tax=Capra hircus TaxID=9925 RepID=A0A8C2RTT2_CAPHI